MAALVMGKGSLTVTNKGEDTVELMLYGQIGADSWFGDGVSARDFRGEVKKARGKTINLRVNSPGGSVFEGAAMKAALDEHTSGVVVDVDGLAASAASFLIMGADTIRLGSNAMLMVHDPYGGVLGTAEDMRKTAETLDKVKEQILDAYTKRTGDKATRDQVAAWMAEETWFTGQEAIDAGLADETTAPVSVAALAGFAPILAKLRVRHAPKALDAAEQAAWEETRRRQRVAAQLLETLGLNREG